MVDEKYYFGFTFYNVDNKWRWLADMAKAESAKEVEQIMKFSGIKYRTYSTLGLRAECDFMLWMAAKSVTDIQKTTSKLYATVFGKYITPSLNYLSCTRKSIYGGTDRTESFLNDSAPKKYAVVYPFTKTREWYLLSLDDRQQMMNEHIGVSRKYPDITLNTTYSFGLDDHDFMLAFETDDLSRFQDLIMDLRATAVSRYVKSDTPMIVCVNKDLISLIDSIG